MKKVFVILWLGQPYVFGNYDSAKFWLLEKVPYLSEYEVGLSIYSRDLLFIDVK